MIVAGLRTEMKLESPLKKHFNIEVAPDITKYHTLYTAKSFITLWYSHSFKLKI